MSQHQIDSDNLPYHPEYVSVNDYFSLDIRSGKIIDVSEYPEMRKPSYKIRVDFGPIIGELSSSAQITNYSRSELIGRLVVGAINLGEKTLPGGFISQFLILGALDPDGSVNLLELPNDVLLGSTIA
jgi:tRNA-binding protein